MSSKFALLVAAYAASIGLSTLEAVAGDVPTCWVTPRITFEWFWCSHCLPITPSSPSFQERHGSDGAFTSLSNCGSAVRCFQAEWSSNAVQVTVSVDLRKQCWDCLGSYSCDGCAWGLMGPMIDRFVFESSTPFFLPAFSTLTLNSAEGLYQTEPKLTHDDYVANNGGGTGFDFIFTPCREDFDASGEVDFADFSLLLLYWGGWWCPPRMDFDSSGEIDGSDLSMLLLATGSCPW